MEELRTKRQKQAAEMRAKIQVTALSLFAEHGFENVSIDMIAKAVGCSVGNIYHYFPNKDSLTVMLTANVDYQYKALKKKYRNSNIDIRERLVEFCGDALAIDSRESLLFQCFVHSIKNPEQGFMKPDVNREYFGLLYRLVAELCETCEISEEFRLDDIMHALIVLNRGLLIEWRIEEGDFDISDRGRKQTRMLLNGILKRKDE